MHNALFTSREQLLEQMSRGESLHWDIVLLVAASPVLAFCAKQRDEAIVRC